VSEVWKSPGLVAKYLEGVRGAIPLAAEQIEVLLRLLRARGQPVRRFLDLGCGDGILSAAVLERYRGALGVLVDFSGPMLDAARSRLSAYWRRVQFACEDYSRSTWADRVRLDGPYDAVISGFSIHHQPDRRKRTLYRQIFSLLGPGGVFVNIEHVSSPTPWVESAWDDYFIDALHRHQPGRTRRWVAAQYHRRPDKAANILAPVERQCQWLRRIGFVDVDCYLKVFELAVFGGRRGFRRPRSLPVE
jgi:SAM-dependent methyltransferase